MLCECHMNELNAKEVEYIKLHNTCVPNGYNVREGGNNGKHMDDEARAAFADKRKGTKHSDKTKENISKGQLGNRRGTKARKHPEDNDLPKYIAAIRKNGIIIGYAVYGFPVGTDGKEYIHKTFQNIDDPEQSLVDAFEYLEHLNDTHRHVAESIEKKKEEALPQKVQEKVEQLNPPIEDHIYPIIVERKIAGYTVKGLVDNENNIIPDKVFNNCTNKWNLDQARKYIVQVRQLLENKVKIDDWTQVDTIHKRDKMGTDTENLPKYINVKFYKGEKAGYYVNGYPLPDGKKSNKCFCNQFRYTMQERYDMALTYLKDLQTKYPIK